MSFDIESNIIAIKDSLTVLTERLTRVETKLDDHIRTEDAWRAYIERTVAARREWWKVGISSLASSGLLLGIWHFITRHP